MVIVQVKPYRRKIGARLVDVHAHPRKYPIPRGKMGGRRTIKSSRTRWLKDRKGVFVGRSSERHPNPETKRPIAKSAWDSTTNVTEDAYGRIIGRTKKS